MQGWNDDWEESSRAGKSQTFDGLDDIVDDLQGESASKPQGKKGKTSGLQINPQVKTTEDKLSSGGVLIRIKRIYNF